MSLSSFTVKNFLGEIPQNVSNANYTKISEFFPTYYGEYFPQKFTEYFPQILWGTFSPNILGNIFPKYFGEFSKAIVETSSTYFWGILRKNEEFS